MGSISKSQASAIADGFLDAQGSGNSKTLQPKETFTEIILLAGSLVEDAQNNLNESNSNASGELSKSFFVEEPAENGSVFKVNVYMNFYGKFINKGVKGTKSGAGLYAFKNNFPSRGMIEALIKGSANAKQKISNASRSKTISKNEIKNFKISDVSKAFGAARNIKMYGIKKTGFLDKAIITTQSKVKDKLGAALKVDVLNAII